MQNIKLVNKTVWIDNNGLELGLEDADGSSINLEKEKTKIESVRLKDYLVKENSIEMLKITNSNLTAVGEGMKVRRPTRAPTALQNSQIPMART